MSLFLVGCATASVDPSDPDALDDHLGRFTLAEEAGMVALCNDEASTVELLDDDVKLDARAARGIRHHVVGPDGVWGTADDAPFGSVEEIDAVYYVGASALERLADYARAHGFEPGPDDLLGVYDGVSFTVVEAESSLDLVNTASSSYLDHTVGLDARAVTSILDHRPLFSVAQLADLYYVGGTALQKIKADAMAEPSTECNLSVSIVDGDQDVYDFNSLLMEATGPEVPWAYFNRLSIDDCPMWHDDAETIEAVLRAAWRFTSFVSYDDPELADTDKVSESTVDAYVRQIENAIAVVDEADWHPSDSYESYLWDRRYEVRDALSGVDPEGAHTYRLFVDMEECSQRAHVVIDADGGMWIIAENPHC